MLVDTSVWIDHLRRGDAVLAARLSSAEVLCHPFVVGELACGNLRRKGEILTLLTALPQAPVATHDEALRLVEAHSLMGRGIGWVDVHLLASARLGGIRLWTRDARLGEAARKVGVRGAP